MASRSSPKVGSGPRSEATDPPAPVPAHSNICLQLEKQIAEIRDRMIRDVIEEFRRLIYEIEEINRGFDVLARTGEILDDLRFKVYRHAEKVKLRRQAELGSAPSPRLNQQAGNDRFPIPIYSGECSSRGPSCTSQKMHSIMAGL